MSPQPELVGNPEKGNQTYCLAGKNLYLIALPDGGSCQLKPTQAESPVAIRWFNPSKGTILNPSGFPSFQIEAPDENDWIAIVRTK
jgi:hypothetical protein